MDEPTTAPAPEKPIITREEFTADRIIREGVMPDGTPFYSEVITNPEIF